MLNKRQKGTQIEEKVADHLKKHGMQLLERNFRSRQGEVDLIGYHDGYLVFVEVKFRSSTIKGSPQEAVGLKKQQRICAVADYYRCTHGIRLSVPVRYDVVAILGEEINWYQNAFPHRGSF